MLFPLILLLILSTQFDNCLSICDSKIYCYGEILHKIQMSRVMNDSKTFVDMPTKFSEDLVEKNFKSLPENPNKTDIFNFLNNNFYAAGFDLTEIESNDWNPHPSYIDLLNKNETDLIQLGTKLNEEWKKLLRKFDSSKLCPSCVSSAIHTSNPFIVPG